MKARKARKARKALEALEAQTARDLLAARLLHEAREELARADNKIAIILASVGIIVGAVVATILSGEWAPYDLPMWLGVLWWAGSMAFLFSVFALGFALYPRVNRSAHKPRFVGYFGDVQALVKAGGLTEALDNTNEASDGRDIDQLIQISSIVARKYQLLRLSLTTLGIGTFLFSLVAVGWGVQLMLVT